MLSRIADSLFWLSRYLERSDHLLRVCSTHYILSLDKDSDVNRSWARILSMFTSLPANEVAGLEYQPEQSLNTILIGPTNTNSLKAIVHKARENARGAQDHITKEVWEQVNQMFHEINDAGVATRLQNFHSIAVMKELTRYSVQYIGWTEITMPRGTGWQFMNLGRYVERAMQTIDLLVGELENVKGDAGRMTDILHWRYLLLAMSGYELHLKTYRTVSHDFNALHQLVINENFSHSILYSLARIKSYLTMIIEGNDPGRESSLLLRNIGRIHSDVSFLETHHLQTTAILPVLTKLRHDLNGFSRHLESQFFSYT